jgi:superfamily II DNA/RNA helicase
MGSTAPTFFFETRPDVSPVEILVLDEADTMLGMGFIHDITKIVSYLPPRHQP